MKYKIQRTDHAKLTQGLLRLCCMIPSYFYQPDEREICLRLLEEIYREALDTKFLRRNNWEPLFTAYNIKKNDEQIFIESLNGKAYLEFNIVKV